MIPKQSKEQWKSQALVELYVIYCNRHKRPIQAEAEALFIQRHKDSDLVKLRAEIEAGKIA